MNFNVRTTNLQFTKKRHLESKEKNSEGEFLFLFIKKTHDHLNFPVKYKEFHDRKSLLKYEIDFTIIARNEEEEAKIIEPRDLFNEKGKLFNSFSFTFRRQDFFKIGHTFDL